MLVDSSVWVNHFRRSNADLEYLLDEGRVFMHPFIIGELACGSLPRNHEAFRLLEKLPCAAVASHDEVLRFVDNHRLFGAGLGWVDVHLLASARLMHQSIWSTDRQLRAAALRLLPAND